MLIGLDFDNTIVGYDRLFQCLAVERALVPPEFPASKQALRDHLRATGREGEWTELQGIAYGPRITGDFLRQCRSAGVTVAVVSHKTRIPYRGEPHDLHVAAFRFLETHGFFGPDTGLSPDRVFLEPTLRQKLARVGSLGCSAFVDDLPEVLGEPLFPTGTRKVLFDPADCYPDRPTHDRVTSWAGCGELLLAGEGVGT
jgi:hypothetical protein